MISMHLYPRKGNLISAILNYRVEVIEVLVKDRMYHLFIHIWEVNVPVCILIQFAGLPKFLSSLMDPLVTD